jgi:hypothetical protein
MSTLKVTNIQATGETASRAVSGVAAAWVNFNGTGTVAARDSVNVSSLTDNGTGYYTVNFSNSMANATYALSLSSDSYQTNPWYGTWIMQYPGSSLASGNFKIGVSNYQSSGAADPYYVYSATLGDLA